MGLTETPPPPYWAVVFSSLRTAGDHGYAAMAEAMESLARLQPGFLGFEHARDESRGISVSYWRSPEAIRAWRENLEHQQAQRAGRERWYARYQVRICKVERAYGCEQSR